MAKASMLFLVFAALVVSPLSVLGDFTAYCPATKASCSSSASVNISVRGPGKCTASANSYCSAFAQSFSCIDFASAYVGGSCRAVYVKEDARCFAYALTKAYADAFVLTDCEGRYAYACGSAESDAYAIACATAAAIVRVHVQLGGGVSSAECEANVAAAIDATAKSVANASAFACSNPYNPIGFDADRDWAKDWEAVWAKAWGSCFAYCDGLGYISYVDAEGGAETGSIGG